MNAEELAKLIKMPFAMVIIGKRASGKTVLCNAFLKAMIESDKAYSVILLSSTAHLNDDFPDLPDSCKLMFSNEMIQTIMDSQERVGKHLRKHIIIVLDDILSLKEASNSPQINSLYTRGRHLFLHPIILSQANSHAVSPQIRANTDYWIIGKTIRPIYEVIWSQIAGIGKKEFVELCEKLTLDYHFVGIDVRANSTRLSDWIWSIKEKN